MDQGEKRQKLVEKKKNTQPHTRRGRRLAEQIAAIDERERLAALAQPQARPEVRPQPQPKPHPQPVEHMGIEVFTEPAKRVLDIPVFQAQRAEIAPALPLPDKISSFEDPRVLPFQNQILNQLDDPHRTDIDEVLKQALRDAPFDDAFRKLIYAFVAIHRHRNGKGPKYEGQPIDI